LGGVERHLTLYHTSMKTPSEKLAERIIEKLVSEKLLSTHEARKLLPKLAEGKLRPDDWRAAIENSMPRKTKL
jgi:hypothetical protein